ncbi:hypothetical protein Tco_0056342 [Tanacetum coccineum]
MVIFLKNAGIQNGLKTPRITKKKCCCAKEKGVPLQVEQSDWLACCYAKEKGVPLQAEQSDWLADTDEEIDEQELEAHYSYMAKIQEDPNAGSYTDYEQLERKISGVYYVEGLNHNLFSVGQFCDADLKVAFRKSTCFVRDLQGNDLLTGNRGSDIYIISLQETTLSTPIYFMAKASPTQAWL